jgi:LPXTG-motif cell wall-anchored protein
MACRATLIRPLALVAAAPILFTTHAAYAGETRNATLHAAHVGATGSGFQQGDCPDVKGWGWHFVVPANGDFVTLSVRFAKAGTVTLGAGDFGPPDASHAYVFTRSDDTLLSGTATVTGGKKDTFNLSHTCPGETEQPPTPTPTTNPPTTNPPTTNPPTTNPPTTSPPTTNPPTTSPPMTTPPATTEPTPTSSATTTSASPTPSLTSTPTGEPTPSQTTSTTGTPAVSPSVKGTKLVRGRTLPQTGTSVVPLALLGCALVAIGGVAILRSTRRRQASRH